jgi:hypothetical protein
VAVLRLRLPFPGGLKVGALGIFVGHAVGANWALVGWLKVIINMNTEHITQTIKNA